MVQPQGLGEVSGVQYEISVWGAEGDIKGKGGGGTVQRFNLHWHQH